MAETYDENGNPIEVYDEEGNPIEVFGENEVKEKVEEVKADLEDKLEEAKIKHEEDLSRKNEEINQIKEDIKAGEGGDKAKNLSGLRKKLEDSEAEKARMKEDHTKEIEGLKSEITGIKETFSNKQIEDAIKDKVGDDKELGDKVRIHFNRIKPTEDTDPIKRAEDFQNRVNEALILARGGVAPDMVAAAAGTQGGFVPGDKAAATTESPTGEVLEMGKNKMGVTDKDVRDHKKAKESGQI